MEDAVARRVHEELNLSCELDFLYKFKYHARFGDLGSEREYCWVYAGEYTGEASAHPEEIAAMRTISPEALTTEMQEHPEQFTPWFKMEWQRIRQDHLEDVLAKLAGRS